MNSIIMPIYFKSQKGSPRGEAGFAHILLLLIILAGIVGGVYLVQHPTFFKPKAAVDGTRIEVVDNNGNPISSTASQDVKVKLTYVAPTVTAYAVGVNYHATGSNFDNSSFIKKYHDPNVRATVRSQLQQMADSGATVIKTMIWLVTPDADERGWTSTFPLSTEELAKIRQYTQDVAAIQAQDGHRLDLYFNFGYLWCADYNTVKPDGTIGQCGLTWPQFTDKTKQSYTDLINNVSDVTRGDGQKVVKIIYLQSETMIGVKVNDGKFLKDLYSDFVNTANVAGITPSVYFHSYPYVSAGINFMQQNNLPVPERIDLSFYPDIRLATDYPALVRQAIDSIGASYPGKKIGFVETNYLMDKTLRDSLGKAIADEYLRRGNPVTTIFWTTPDGGTQGAHVSFPFDINSYLPASAQIPSSFPTHFRVANSQDELTGDGQDFVQSIEIPWTLTNGSGQKTVYAQFKVDGVWQTAISTNVTYDPSTSTNPSLSVDKTNIAVNESVIVSWTGSTTALDWIGIFPTSAPAGSQGYVDWKYTGNCTKDKNTTDIKVSGSCPFTLPANATGDYEFRMFANNTNTYMNATSPAITVTGTSLGFGVPKGSTMAVSWTGSQSALDWIGIYPAGTDDNYIDWKYTGNCSRDKETVRPAMASGSCNFTMPNTSGSYEFRIFSNNTSTKITTSPPITVTD